MLGNIIFFLGMFSGHNIGSDIITISVGSDFRSISPVDRNHGSGTSSIRGVHRGFPLTTATDPKHVRERRVWSSITHVCNDDDYSRKQQTCKRTWHVCNNKMSCIKFYTECARCRCTQGFFKFAKKKNTILVFLDVYRAGFKGRLVGPITKFNKWEASTK